MTLRDIDIICAICEEQNITRAAERLFISQPTVSNVLRSLEASYECKLFEKTHRRLIPTKQGLYVYSIAQKIQALNRDLDVNSVQNCAGIPIHAGFYSSFSEGPLNNLLAFLQSSGYEIKPTINNYRSLVQLLAAGSLDFALTDYYVKDSTIIGIPIFRDLFVPFCSEDFPCKDRTSLSGLTNYPLIVRENGSGDYQITSNLFAKHKLAFRPWMETTSNYALYEAVRNGYGIGFTSISYFDHVAPNGGLRQIHLTNGSLKKERFILFAKKDRADPRLKKFLNMVVDYLHTTESQTASSEIIPWSPL